MLKIHKKTHKQKTQKGHSITGRVIRLDKHTTQKETHETREELSHGRKE